MLGIWSFTTPLYNRPSGIFIPIGFSEKPSLGWPISHWVGLINLIPIVAVLLVLFFVRLQKYAGYVKVTPNSHWGSIKMAG